MKKPRILVVNDDGFDAIGIQILARHLLKYGDVVVYAPADHQSAQSQAITVFRPLKREEVFDLGYKCYKIDGKPADCVRFATGIEEEFDLVVSGINNGFNIGIDTLYSGTVGAATDGNLHGISSIALSAPRGKVEEFEKYLDSGNFTVKSEQTVSLPERFEIHEISVPYEGDKFAVYDNEINDFYIADDNLTHWFDTEEEALADLEEIKNRIASENAVVKETSEPEFPYNVGDVIYLEDNTPFVIEAIGEHDIRMRDTTLVYPISRAESRESFARLLEQYPQAKSAPEVSDVVEIKPDSLKLTIGFSEHPAFYDKQLNDRFTDLSFALGNRLLGVLDEKQHRERNEKEIGWYHKTDFRIDAVIDGEDFTYTGRFDIGDGEGDFNVVGADVGHGFGEPCAVDCELRFRCRQLVGWYLNFKRGAVFLGRCDCN